jgi:Uma2 family endonuclease
MSTEHSSPIASQIVLHFGRTLRRMSGADFFRFCQRNGDWRIERTAQGDLIIMPPRGGGSGARNFDLTGQFWSWCSQDGTGVGFDSSTGFRLPNGAERSPDLAWVRRQRWDALAPEEREEFPPLAPDFVVELRSKGDSPKKLRAKMQEYIDCGTQLGWLIDPIRRRVIVFRSGQAAETLERPAAVSGDPVLPGFVLKLATIWS